MLGICENPDMGTVFKSKVRKIGNVLDYWQNLENLEKKSVENYLESGHIVM